MLRSREDYTWSKEDPGKGAPHPSAIDRAEEAMEWFRLLPLADESRLLLELAGCRGFNMMAGKKIGGRMVGPRWKFHADRPARTYCAAWLREKHERALVKLLRRLKNGSP